MVQSETDKKIIDAKENVNRALESLVEVVLERCIGLEDYTSLRKMKIKSAFDLLLKVKDELA